MKTASPSTRTASRSLRAAKKELAAGRSKLESGQQQLNSLAKTVTDALAGTGSPYAGAPGKLLDDLGRGDSAAIAATDAALGGMRAQLEGGIAQAQEKIDEMQAQLTEVNKNLSALEQTPTEGMPEEQLAAYQAQLAELQGAKQKLEAGIAEAQAKKSGAYPTACPAAKRQREQHRRKQAGTGQRLERVLQRRGRARRGQKKSCLTPKSS